MALVALPAACVCRGAPQVIISGGDDNFRSPPKPVTPGARLLASHMAKIYPPGRFRRFDQDGEDLLFLTSIPLPTRKICSAQFELRVRRRARGGLSYEFNDFLLIGFAPFGASGFRKSLFRSAMWAGDPPDVSTKIARFSLPASELNRFLLMTSAPYYLDVVLHDDTTVDYVKLILRFE